MKRPPYPLAWPPGWTRIRAVALRERRWLDEDWFAAWRSTSLPAEVERAFTELQ